MTSRMKLLVAAAVVVVAAIAFLLVLLTTVTEVTWCDDVGLGGESQCYSEWRWGWW